jgi:hypothetical protein
LYAEDLKKGITLLEKEKLQIGDKFTLQLDELKRDKQVLSQFIKLKDKTIEERQH